MRLAIVMSRLSNGGLERVQSNLAHEFCARGIDTTLAIGRILHRQAGDFPPAATLVEIAGRGPASFPAGLFRFLKRNRPDCVFTTSNDLACVAIALRRLAFPRMRVISTHHLSLSGPLGQARGMRRMKLLAVRALMRRMLAAADGIVAVTQQVADDLVAQVGLDPARIRVIHNPIVGEDFDRLVHAPVPTLPWIEDGSPVVVFAGRLSPEKRPDLVLDAFRALTRERAVRLLILGDGPLRSQVQQRIVDEGLDGRCVLAGHVDNVFPLMATADVLVLASDYEGFGNVLVEAMACGVQVVATDCPHGPAEILAGGRYGQLVPTGDAPALAAALARSLSGERRVEPAVLRQRAGEFGVARAADAYLDTARAPSA